MTGLTQFFYVLILAGIAATIFLRLKNNPELLNKANFSKSFHTMGIMALGIIILITLMVYMLK